MKQLNLFDFDEELLEEEPLEQTLKSKTQDNIQSVPNIKHSFEQINTDEVNEFKLGDKVKIQLIDEALDSETHHYRKYYEPHLIGKVGEVKKVIKKKNNQYTYEVNIYGAVSHFEEAELVWIG